MFLKVFIFVLVQGFCQSFDILGFRNDHVRFINRYLRTLITEDTFEQKIDHFNESDHRTFNMRYLKSMSYWNPGGPIILLINGESPLYTNASSTVEEESRGPGILAELLEETSAACFMLEHRYYGESKPFKNPTVGDLKYLSSKQALADIAHVLQVLKASEDFKDSKVIVIGGSYAGNLAAWMKVVYPNLVDAVLSSSAPVLAKKDFYEYYEGVTETFKTYGSQDCVDKISAKFNSIQELLQTPEGIEKIKKEHKICAATDMTVSENQQVLFGYLAGRYAGRAQYGRPKDIKALCDTHLPFSRNLHDEPDCYDMEYNTAIRKMFTGSLWLWLYQTCTEFGYFQTTTSKNQIFGQETISLEFYLKACKVIFGEEFDEQRIDQGIINTNNMYGGLTPNVEKVVFSNSDMDPWHKLGVLRDLSAEAPAVYIMGASHCSDLDLRPDSKDINDAMDKIKNYLKQWIGAQT